LTQYPAITIIHVSIW